MEQEPAEQTSFSLVDLGERGMYRGNPGRRAVGPAAPQSPGEAIEQIEAVALDKHKGEGDDAGYGNADSDRDSDLQIGSQIDQ